MANARGTFEVTTMGEDTYQTLEGGGKLTRATGAQRFSGDITGVGSVEWLMCYSADGSARFLGIQRIVGSIGDQTGSFVLEAVGDFDGQQSKGTWTIIGGSGSGDLSTLRGQGTFHAASGPNAAYELEYQLG